VRREAEEGRASSDAHEAKCLHLGEGGKDLKRKIGECERANLGELRYERDNAEQGLDVDVARTRMSELHRRERVVKLEAAH
jgi:hypothetical protein